MMPDQAPTPTDLAGEAGDDVATNGALDDTVDAHGEPVARTITVDAESTAAAGDNNLLSELARAMHAAATAQYERLNAELERLRAEQVEAISARAGAEIENLNADSETDIGSIELWAKAEIEKLKLERLRRIDARREALAGQLERHDTIKEREIFAIEVAIDAHRNEVDQFFGRMERETDPATIARVAASMPAFPALDEVAAEARRGAIAEFAAIDRQELTPTSETEATTGAVEIEAPAVTSQPNVEAAQADVVAADAVAATAETTGTEAATAESATLGTEPAEPRLEPVAMVTESRLKGVMDPAASRGDADSAKPWEAPHAVSVAAGSGKTEEEPAPTSVGSTLLRTVRSIRPMARHDKDSSEGDTSR